MKCYGRGFKANVLVLSPIDPGSRNEVVPTGILSICNSNQPTCWRGEGADLIWMLKQIHFSTITLRATGVDNKAASALQLHLPKLPKQLIPAPLTRTFRDKERYKNFAAAYCLR